MALTLDSSTGRHSPGKKPFKIVIVGAGLSGLLLAHLLIRIDVDFVVLESHPNVVYPAGGSFGCWPNAARILDQIGIWKHVEAAGIPMGKNYIRKPDASVMVESDVARRMGEIFGYDFRVLERYRYCEILYNALPDRSKVWTGKRVTNVLERPDGVRVAFDGGECTGDIVVGCDGPRSTVRSIMWDDAARISPGLINESEKQSLTSSYRCLVGAATSVARLKENESSMVQNQGKYMVIICQPGQILFFVCFKEKEVKSWPDVSKFTANDAAKQAASISHLPVTKDVTFGQIWEKRTRGYLTALEEGVFEHWFFGRMVLLGDSAHKMSPVGAHGGNVAIESVAVFANTLESHLRHTASDSVDMTTIRSIFQTYQEARKERVRKVAATVETMTRLGTWDTLKRKFIAIYVLPWLDEVSLVSKLINGAPKIDFLPESIRAKGFSNQRQVGKTPVKGIFERVTSLQSLAVYSAIGGIACTIFFVLRLR